MLSNCNKLKDYQGLWRLRYQLLLVTFSADISVGMRMVTITKTRARSCTATNTGFIQSWKELNRWKLNETCIENFISGRSEAGGQLVANMLAILKILLHSVSGMVADGYRGGWKLIFGFCLELYWEGQWLCSINSDGLAL